jgi:hypothetical protein
MSPSFQSQRRPIGAEIDSQIQRDPDRWTVDWYCIHGVTLAVYTDDVIVRAPAAGLLRDFAQAAPAAMPPAVRLCLTTRQAWPLPPQVEKLPPSTNEVVDIQKEYGLAETIARLDSVVYFELAPLAGAMIDPQDGAALAWIQPALAGLKPAVFTNLFLQTVVLESLRGHGLYWVHAACVAESGRAVLLVGASGSGKTTTGLNLVLNGFRFLSQDRTLLRLTGEGLDLLAFPEDLAVTEASLTLLPNLRVRLGELPKAMGKHQLDPIQLFPQSLSQEAAPGLILFLRVAHADQTFIRPIRPAAALQRLLPNSLLASLPAVTARHFEALHRLAQDSRSYDVALGRDIERQPGIVRELLTR